MLQRPVQLVEGHCLRGFRGAVEIHLGRIGGCPTYLLEQHRAERIAPPEQITQPLEHTRLAARAGCHQLAQRRREVHRGDAMAVYPSRQARRVEQGRLRRADNLGANRQRREHIPVNGVVSQAGQ